MAQSTIHKADRNEITVLFSVFCLWSFVLIGRPQDILRFLVPLRLALSFCILTMVMFLATNAALLNKIDFSNRQLKRFCFLFAVMIFSIPFAYYRRRAFMFVFTEYISNVIFFFLFFMLVDSVKRIKTVLFICCLATTVYSLFAMHTGSLIHDRLRVGQMFDPNDLAFFIISFLPFNFLFMNSNEPILKRVIVVLNCLISLVVILMTGSRGGLLALGMAVLFLLFRKTKTIPRTYKVLFLVFLVGGIFAKRNVIDFSRYATLLDPGQDYNVTGEFGRKEIWEKGLQLMLTHPLTGVGAACFGQALGEVRGKEGLLPRWQTAHNSWVLIGTETGIIGFILFGVLNFAAFRTFLSVSRKPGSDELMRIGEMAVIGFVGHFTAAMFLSQAYSVYWVFYIVLSAVLLRSGQENVNGNSEPQSRSPYSSQMV